MKQEIWKPIKGFENYEISNKGRIKSLNFRRKKGQAKVMKNRKSKRGYYTITLFNEYSKCCQKKIARLVAEAFIPNPDNKPQINHKNGIKTDNRVENLEWCTPKENSSHAYEIGLSYAPKGEECHLHKLTENQVKEIRQKYGKNRNKKLKDIGKEYGVSYHNIGNILNYKRWRHI